MKKKNRHTNTYIQYVDAAALWCSCTGKCHSEHTWITFLSSCSWNCGSDSSFPRLKVSIWPSSGLSWFLSNRREHMAGEYLDDCDTLPKHWWDMLSNQRSGLFIVRKKVAADWPDSLIQPIRLIHISSSQLILIIQLIPMKISPHHITVAELA